MTKEFFCVEASLLKNKFHNEKTIKNFAINLRLSCSEQYSDTEASLTNHPWFWDSPIGHRTSEKWIDVAQKLIVFSYAIWTQQQCLYNEAKKQAVIFYTAIDKLKNKQLDYTIRKNAIFSSREKIKELRS